MYDSITFSLGALEDAEQFRVIGDIRGIVARAPESVKSARVESRVDTDPMTGVKTLVFTIRLLDGDGEVWSSRVIPVVLD